MVLPKWLRLNHRRFLILLFILFVVRGIQIQCLYPPLEGPDEYQHIAYLVYLHEQHHLPVYGQATVPLSLYPSLVENPHSQYDWEQTGIIGALRYNEFYDRSPNQISTATIQLYQAQHPPLYYVVVSPLFNWLQNEFDFRTAVYAIRLLNIFLAGIAMLWLLAPLQYLFKDNGLFRPAALAISLSPMFMIYVSRVANDALALVFVGAAVWLLMRWRAARYQLANAALIGSMLGLGTLTKLTSVSLLPVALAYLLTLALCAKVKWRTAGLSILVILVAYLTFTLPYLIQNIRTYGIPLVAQETLINARNGKSLIDIFQAIRVDHIRSFFIDRLLRENLWTSGWSFLGPAQLFINVYTLILAIAFSGFFAGMYRIWVKRMPISTSSLEAITVSILIVIFTVLAAYAHALSGIVAWGVIVTPSYYIMVGYPAFLGCAFAAAGGYGRRAVLGLAAALTFIFLATEYHSLLWIAAPFWAHANNWAMIFNRLDALHPTFLSAWLFFPLAALVIFLVGFLVWNNWLVYFQEAAVSRTPSKRLTGDAHADQLKD